MSQKGKEFLLLAQRMRAAQVEYFKFRGGSNLKAAQKLEKQFDEALRDLSPEHQPQQKLQLA